MNLEKYKTLSPRFFSLLIDGLILISLIYLESFLSTPEMPVPIAVGGLIIYYFCTHFYSIYLHAVYGQTLGKMAMKVTVLDISESPIDGRQAVLREVPFLAFSLIFMGWEIYQITAFGITENFRNSFFDYVMLVILTIWLIAEFAVALSSEKRRSIHDLIAGTVVVRTNM